MHSAGFSAHTIAGRLGGLPIYEQHAQLLVDTMSHCESEQSYALDTNNVITAIADMLVSVFLLLNTQRHEGIAYADVED